MDKVGALYVLDKRGHGYHCGTQAEEQEGKGLIVHSS